MNTSKDEQRNIEVRKECTECHQTISVFLTEEEYRNLNLYLNGVGLVHDMLPNLSIADREFLAITGICGKCWKHLFGSNPQESDE